ncbi:MAG: DUF523 domain-containing protein [Eubacteriales bacterium]
MNILVSACLMGANCRFDGIPRSYPSMEILAKGGDKLFPFCPECAAGLPTPRLRAECQGNMVVTEAMEDVTSFFELGAMKALEVAMEHQCTIAILKERSPSCGCGLIYDGSFSGNLVEGMGVTAKRLVQAGIFILGESALENYLNKPRIQNQQGISSHQYPRFTAR